MFCKGMFLGDVPAGIAVFFQPGDKRGFPGSAWTNNADHKWCRRVIVHYRERFGSTGEVRQGWR
jgi:hypothetical protein